MDVKVLLQSTKVGEGGRTMSTLEPFLARVAQPVRLHVFLTGEPLWTTITFVRPCTRVSHHVALQVPSAGKFPSTYVTIQLARLLVEFAVFPKVVNCLEFLSTVIVGTSQPERWSIW